MSIFFYCKVNLTFYFFVKYTLRIVNFTFPMEKMKTLIKEKRTSLNMTQEELAKRLNVRGKR